MTMIVFRIKNNIKNRLILSWVNARNPTTTVVHQITESPTFWFQYKRNKYEKVCVSWKN